MKRFEDMTPGEKARYCKKRYAELKNEAELMAAEARSNKGSGVKCVGAILDAK